MSIDVNEIVQDMLQKARNVISAGEFWSPTVLLVCRNGIEGFALSDVGRTPQEKQKVTDFIANRIKDRGATLAIMITDVWVAEVAKSGTLPASARNHPGRTEALVVTIWGPKQPTTMGMQSYSRDRKGKPVFQEFFWQEGQERSASVFAGQDLDAVFDGDTSADDATSPPPAQ